MRRTQSFLRPAADPQQWTWDCCPPGSASRCFACAGRCEAIYMWHQLDRWPRSVAWRCGHARHPGTWAPWWTGWRQPGWTELEEGKGERKWESKWQRIRKGLLLTFYCFFRSLSVCHSDHLALWRNVMFRQYWLAVNYFVVKLSDLRRRKCLFPFVRLWRHTHTHHSQSCVISSGRHVFSNKTWCVAHTSSRTLKSFISPHDVVHKLCVRDMFSAPVTHISLEKITRETWIETGRILHSHGNVSALYNHALRSQYAIQSQWQHCSSTVCGSSDNIYITPIIS